MKKHSQIVQFDSQIVQIFLFSLQIAIFRYIKNPCHAGDRDAFKSGVMYNKYLVGTAEDESLNLSVI
jgi:hypothetical protein